LTVDDVVSPHSLKFEDFNIKPVTTEETIVRFVRMFRPIELQRAPIDRDIKSYEIQAAK
jgi:hypothetical protein